MEKYYADLHVHIGFASNGRVIKMATARNLTFENIAYESLYRKGINVIGVVDCLSPHILKDIDNLVENGELTESAQGGMLYRGEQTLLLGAEIETHEPGGCCAHSLCYMPTLEQMKLFSKEMSKHINNIYTCCFVSKLGGQGLFDIVEALGGILIPAHVFTPHKSFYGCCCNSLLEIFNDRSYEKIPAVELGLSSDTRMASMLSELDGKAFLSDSDAHSLPKIGREYNVLELESPFYEEVLKALRKKEGRRVAANYGLNPLLGKYHRTFCLVCEKVLGGEPPVLSCPVSERHPVVTGVRDRLEIIRDRESPDTSGRPPYHYQIPPEFIPGVGPKAIDKLISKFGNEMNVLHGASFEELKEVVKEDTARRIVLAREGSLRIDAGGGGIYGSVVKETGAARRRNQRQGGE